jgi:hypothetical protein
MVGIGPGLCYVTTMMLQKQSAMDGLQQQHANKQNQ